MMNLTLFKNFPINDYANQVYYNTEAEQKKAFNSYKEVIKPDLASCNKSEKTIRLDINYYQGNKYNYGMIEEANKTYFIFITSVEWKSNLTTCILHYEYDYWQTYCHRITFQDSFVEREHVPVDTYGAYIIDEGLPIDEYKIKESVVLNGDAKGMYFCLACTDTSGVLQTGHSGGTAISNTCQPSKYEYSTSIIFSDDLEVMNVLIRMLTLKNKLDGVSGLYMIPKSAIPDNIKETAYFEDTGDPINYVGINKKQAEMLKYQVNRPTDIDGYKPINNKCFSYPYCFANFTNNNGNSMKGQFELSNDKSKIDFYYYFPCVEANTSFGYLNEYDGVVKNLDYSIQGQTNVELPFVTNIFASYMAANQNSISNQYSTLENNTKVGFIKNWAGFLGGLASGNVGSAVSSVTSAVDTGINYYNQKNAMDSALKDQESKADVPHGAFTGVANITVGQIGFKAQTVTITAENCKMIDDYFSMFGYKINQIKVPKFDSRPYWNYIKTSGVNLIGNIPQDALNVIKQMFDNGTTIWHSIDYVYKYNEYKEANHR